MFLCDFCEYICPEQMIALQLNNEIVWIGKPQAVMSSEYWDYTVDTIDLAVATFQPKYCCEEHSWNNLLINIKKSTYSVSIEGFRHLCYEIYKDDWLSSHTGEAFIGMQPVTYEEFISNEYSDMDIMKQLLVDGMLQFYTKLEGGLADEVSDG